MMPDGLPAYQFWAMQALLGGMQLRKHPGSIVFEPAVAGWCITFHARMSKFSLTVEEEGVWLECRQCGITRAFPITALDDLGVVFANRILDAEAFQAEHRLTCRGGG